MTQARRSGGSAATTASGPSAAVWMSPSPPANGTAMRVSPPGSAEAHSTAYPWASISTVRPPAAGTSATGTRGSTAMRTVPGQSRQTRADLTQGSEAIDFWARSRSSESIGTSVERPVLSSTSASRAPLPSMDIRSTSISGVRLMP